LNPMLRIKSQKNTESNQIPISHAESIPKFVKSFPKNAKIAIYIPIAIRIRPSLLRCESFAISKSAFLQGRHHSFQPSQQYRDTDRDSNSDNSTNKTKNKNVITNALRWPFRVSTEWVYITWTQTFCAFVNIYGCKTSQKYKHLKSCNLSKWCTEVLKRTQMHCAKSATRTA